MITHRICPLTYDEPDGSRTECGLYVADEVPDDEPTSKYWSETTCDNCLYERSNCGGGA